MIFFHINAIINRYVVGGVNRSASLSFRLNSNERHLHDLSKSLLACTVSGTVAFPRKGNLGCINALSRHVSSASMDINNMLQNQKRPFSSVIRKQRYATTTMNRRRQQQQERSKFIDVTDADKTIDEDWKIIHPKRLRAPDVETVQVIRSNEKLRLKDMFNSLNSMKTPKPPSMINMIKGIVSLPVYYRSYSSSTSVTESSQSGEDNTNVVSAASIVAVQNSSYCKIYNPWDIVDSFDASYYYPPKEEMEPEYLAAKYSELSNDELMDPTTIRIGGDGISASGTDGGKSDLWTELIHSPPILDSNRQFPKGTLVGTVVSTKMQKTINVAVDRYRVHKKYRKRLKYTKKFMAHDESEVACDGDTVLIVPCQRISKNKHFILRKIVKAKGRL